MTVTHHVADNPVGQIAQDHPGLVKMGRVGWLAKGIVYAIAGILALMVAWKASEWSDASGTGGDQEASPNGALKTVPATAGGTPVTVPGVVNATSADWQPCTPGVS